VAQIASTEIEPGDAAKPRVQSVARGASILLAVAQSAHGLTTKEISEACGIGRQATYHLIHTLVATGLLARSEGRRYVLGLRIGTLAEAFKRQLDPPEYLAPIVRRIAVETGETAYAVGWRNGEIVAFSRARGANSVQAAEIPEGQAGDAHARATGKLLLAYATPDGRRDYLAAHPLSRRTPNTVTDAGVLESQLAKIRDQGYVIESEEFAIGISCIATALDGGMAPFALGLSAPTERCLANADRYLEVMRRASSSAMGSALGHSS
jgi:IclR family acetate operon transcriptional repressor